MVAHGLSTAALFMIAGALQERLHTRALADMGGLWKAMPRMGAMAMFFVIASVGLPGLGNFIAEFLVLAGLWQSSPVLCAFAAIGLVTGAVYALWMLQQAFHGPLGEQHVGLQDFNTRDMTALGLLAIGLLGLGLYPQPALDLIAPSLDALAIKVGG